jgi:hypothetical protein
VIQTDGKEGKMNLGKRTAARVAVGVLAAGVVAVAAPVAAQAATITGPGTSVTFSGSGGDYITQDQAWSYDPSNSVINATVSPDGNSLSVDINGNTTWELDFAAPQGQALTAGTVYNNAARWPFQGPTQPGLSLFGDGRGCNTVTGSFTVKSATFGPHGWIQSFDATFVQHCEGDPNSEATGEVILNNGPPPPDLTVTVTPALIGNVSHAGGHVVISGTVTCNRAVTVGLSGTLDQRLNRTVLATGNWSASAVACTTKPTHWSATVQPQGNVPFGNGHAVIDGTYSSFDPVFQFTVTGTFSRDIMLRHT